MYRICTLAPLRIIKSIVDNSVHTRGDLDCSIFPRISIISLITDIYVGSLWYTFVKTWVGVGGESPSIRTLTYV